MSEPTVTPAGTVPVDRPDPLGSVTKLLAPGMAAVTAILTYLVSQGLVDQAVADAVNAVGGAVVVGVNDSTTSTVGTMPVWASVVSAILAGAGAALTAVLHGKLSRPRVTPKDDPRNDDGIRLVPADPAVAGPATRSVRGTTLQTPGTSPSGFRPDLGRGTHERAEDDK